VGEWLLVRLQSGSTLVRIQSAPLLSGFKLSDSKVARENRVTAMCVWCSSLRGRHIEWGFHSKCGENPSLTCMKCIVCLEDKNDDDFPWRDATHTKRKSNCKICQNKRVCAWNARNKVRKLEHRQEQRRRNVEWYVSLKTAPCSDCGLSFPPAAMDFHHRPGELKLANVAEMLDRVGKAKILAEIAKCDLLCAICHRLQG
jgi:hypothetical protein